MDNFVVQCKILSEQNVGERGVAVRIVEYIRGENYSREIVVPEESLVWVDEKKEEPYVRVLNVFPTLYSYAGLIAQVQALKGLEDLSIHPDSFVKLSQPNSF